MDRQSYTATAAAALRQLMDDIAALHLPPGMSLQGPRAEETARWLRTNLDELGARLGSRLEGVEPPSELAGFHEKLLAQYAYPEDENPVTRAESMAWNDQLYDLCQETGIEYPLGEETRGAEAAELELAVEQISQLVYGADDDSWEQKVRGALGDMTPEDQDQVVEYLRELRQESR